MRGRHLRSTCTQLLFPTGTHVTAAPQTLRTVPRARQFPLGNFLLGPSSPPIPPPRCLCNVATPARVSLGVWACVLRPFPHVTPSISEKSLPVPLGLNSEKLWDWVLVPRTCPKHRPSPSAAPAPRKVRHDRTPQDNARSDPGDTQQLLRKQTPASHPAMVPRASQPSPAFHGFSSLGS